MDPKVKKKKTRETREIEKESKTYVIRKLENTCWESFYNGGLQIAMGILKSTKLKKKCYWECNVIA